MNVLREIITLDNVSNSQLDKLQYSLLDRGFILESQDEMSVSLKGQKFILTPFSGINLTGNVRQIKIFKDKKVIEIDSTYIITIISFFYIFICYSIIVASSRNQASLIVLFTFFFVLVAFLVKKINKYRVLKILKLAHYSKA